jgi:hypothetical protein
LATDLLILPTIAKPSRAAFARSALRARSGCERIHIFGASFMNKSALALAGLGFAAGILLIILAEPMLALWAEPKTKCAGIATVDTVKRLALKKLKDDFDSAQYLLKSANQEERNFILIAAISDGVEFTLSGFRDRGKLGEGSICAALIDVRAINRKESAQMSAEYSVEPSSDGRVMVSARFMPN